MAFETVTGTHRYVITNLDTGFKVELFRLSSDPHDQERFRHRTSVSLAGRTAFVTTGEDVVIQKVKWLRLGNRSKDRDDLIAVISVSGDTIDWSYIERWCLYHGTWELLQQIRAENHRVP